MFLLIAQQEISEYYSTILCLLTGQIILLSNRINRIMMRASRACEPCARSKLRCEDARPCARCIRDHCEELCKDREIPPRRKFKRVKEIPFVQEGLVSNANPRFKSFERYQEFMMRYAEDISPFAWMDLLYNSPIVKLKAFEVLSSLFLTPKSLKSFMVQLSVVNLSPITCKEVLDEILIRVQNVCDHPIHPLLPAPKNVEDAGEISSSLVQFCPPLENEARIQTILKTFKFKNLPVVEGWERPAIFLCDIDIDCKENTIKTCAYLNEEGEKLWGYSSRELYNSALQRDIQIYSEFKGRAMPSMH
jgi:hypothetical protein